MDLRKQIKYEQRATFKKYQENIEESLKINSKFFFAFTKARKETNSLPNLMKFGNIETDNPVTIPNLFADYFEEVYEDNSNDKFTTNSCNCNSHFKITKNHIIDIIKKWIKIKITVRMVFPKSTWILCT